MQLFKWNATAGLDHDNKATSPGLPSHSGLANKEQSESSGGVWHMSLSRKERIEISLYEVGPFYKSNGLPFGVWIAQFIKIVLSTNLTGMKICSSLTTSSPKSYYAWVLTGIRKRWSWMCIKWLLINHINFSSVLRVLKCLICNFT